MTVPRGLNSAQLFKFLLTEQMSGRTAGGRATKSPPQRCPLNYLFLPCRQITELSPPMALQELLGDDRANSSLNRRTECVNSSVSRFGQKFPSRVGHTTAAVQPGKKKNARRT